MNEPDPVPKQIFEVVVLLLGAVFLLLAGSGIFNFLTRLRAIEHGGYVECNLANAVESCSGPACDTAAAVCDKELFRVLREPAQ